MAVQLLRAGGAHADRRTRNWSACFRDPRARRAQESLACLAPNTRESAALCTGGTLRHPERLLPVGWIAMRASHASRRTLMEWMMTLGGVVLIAAVVSTLDVRIGGYAASAVRGTGAASGVSNTVSETLRSVLDLCRDHQPLAVFSGVALVLMVFMRRMR
jgi:hypothetical protein